MSDDKILSNSCSNKAAMFFKRKLSAFVKFLCINQWLMAIYWVSNSESRLIQLIESFVFSWTKWATMRPTVAFVLCLLSMSCSCLASQANFIHHDDGFDTQNDSYNNFSLNILDLLLKESYPDFLTRLSYTNLSEVCQNQTRSFAQKLDPQTLSFSDLNNGFWNLKSNHHSIKASKLW